MPNQMKRLAGSVVIGAVFAVLVLLRPALSGTVVDIWGIVGVVLGASAVAYLLWAAVDAAWPADDRKVDPKWVVRFAVFAVANFVIPHALATLTGWSIVVTTLSYMLLLLLIAFGWLLSRGYRLHR